MLKQQLAITPGRVATLLIAGLMTVVIAVWALAVVQSAIATKSASPAIIGVGALRQIIIIVNLVVPPTGNMLPKQENAAMTGTLQLKNAIQR